MSRFWICLLCPLLFSTASAQPPETREQGKDAQPQASGASGNGDAPDREQKLADFLDGCKFIGQFTVDGRNNMSPKPEEYTISSCIKLPEEDMYRLTARIKYGDKDNEVPIDLKILWAGSTPVITLDSLWIPGMGTFSSRVLIQRNRYSGTWQHDEKGGHLFGRIEQLSETASEENPE